MEEVKMSEPNWWQISEELLEWAHRLQDEALFLEATALQSRLLAGLPPCPEKGEEEE